MIKSKVIQRGRFDGKSPGYKGLNVSSTVEKITGDLYKVVTGQ
jgi:hypothetical protein